MPELRTPTADQAMLPQFDYTELPLGEEVELLRSLGRQILITVLLEKRLPNLPALLTQAHVQANKPWLIWTTLLRRYLGHGQQAFWDDLGLSLGESFRQLRKRRWRASYQAMRQLPPRIVLTNLLNRLEWALGTVSPVTIPDDMLALVAATAWGDLTFQHEIATQLRTYLRQSVLFTQHDKVLILLSPHTFWILLALTPISTALSFDWLRRDYWLLRWAAQRLQQAATQHGLTAEGWAGFWDQWVIWTAMTHYPDAVVRLRPALYNALIALPIFQLTATSKQWQSPNGLGATVDERTKTAAQTANVGRVGEPTPTLAAPTWKAAMPGWFPGQYVHPTPDDER